MMLFLTLVERWDILRQFCLIIPAGSIRFGKPALDLALLSGGEC
jgi:hypothetical protein